MEKKYIVLLILGLVIISAVLYGCTKREYQSGTVEGKLFLDKKTGNRYIVNQTWIIGDVPEGYLGMEVRVSGKIFESECEEMYRKNPKHTLQCMGAQRMKIESIELIEVSGTSQECSLAKDCCGWPIECVYGQITPLNCKNAPDCAEPSNFERARIESTICVFKSGKCEMKEDNNVLCGKYCEYITNSNCVDYYGDDPEQIWEENCNQYSCECIS